MPKLKEFIVREPLDIDALRDNGWIESDNDWHIRSTVYPKYLVMSASINKKTYALDIVITDKEGTVYHDIYNEYGKSDIVD